MAHANALLVKEIRKRFHQLNHSKRRIAKDLGCCIHTIRKYCHVNSEIPPFLEETPLGDSFTAKQSSLPDPIERDTSVAEYSLQGTWWVLSDVHIPFHNREALEIGAAEARRRGCVGILLNGDIIDCLGLSSKFHRRPDDHTFKLERQYGLQFLAWLREQFPKAVMVYKTGNHEERLTKYIAEKAPELFDVEQLSLPSLLDFDSHKVEMVDDQRLIRLGRLCVLHGHELARGIAAPVNPARGAFLKAVHTVMVGHHHQTSEHHERDITGQSIVTWSTGCNCTLQPRYAPYNRWNHGAAFVEVFKSGEFSVTNYKIIEGILR